MHFSEVVLQIIFVVSDFSRTMLYPTNLASVMELHESSFDARCTTIHTTDLSLKLSSTNRSSYVVDVHNTHFSILNNQIAELLYYFSKIREREREERERERERE